MNFDDRLPSDLPTRTSPAKPSRRGITYLQDLMPAMHVAYSPDGRELVVGGGLPGEPGLVTVLDAATYTLRQSLTINEGEPGGLAFSGDGEWFVVYGADGHASTLRRWHAGAWEEGTPVVHPEGSQIVRVAFGLNKRTLGVACWNPTAGRLNLEIWNVDSGERWVVLSSPEATAPLVAFFESSRGASPKWDDITPSGKEPLRAQRFLTTSGERSVAHTPSGKESVLLGTRGDMRLYDVTTGKEVWSVDKFRQGRPQLYTALLEHGLVFDVSEQGRLRTWDICAGTHTMTVVGARSPAIVMTASPAANCLAIGREDGSIHLMDIVECKTLAKVRAHLDPVVSLAFSPDGKKLAAIYAIPCWRTVVFDLDVLR